MKALILNSGTGSRMGSLTANKPKCMLELATGETIISRQLRQLAEIGVKRAVVTTGKYHALLRDYCLSLALPVDISFVKNDRHDTTNYIYSIYLARRLLDGDILSLHGDLVFDAALLEKQPLDSMAVCSTAKLSQKDFKAVIENGKIVKVGVEFFENAIAAQPLYKLGKQKWLKWLTNIAAFCESGQTNVYAENALNIEINPFDFGGLLCGEADTPEDLEGINERLACVR